MTTSTDPDVYTGVEESLYSLMELDPYFGSLPEGLRKEYVQTVGHLESSKNTSDLLPSAEAVDDFFDVHQNSLDCMAGLVKSLRDGISEFKNEQKALKKAMKDLAKKQEAERKRELAKQKRLEEKERKAAAKAEAAAKAAEGASDGEDNKGNEKASKKRRVASKVLQELGEEDPMILRSRFPDSQIPVVEDFEAWLQMLT